MKARDSRPRTPNRLCVELECDTVGVQFQLCGLELWSTSEYPTVSSFKVAAPGAPGVTSSGQDRNALRRGLSRSPAGPAPRGAGANGSSSGNQLLNTKAVNAAALEEGRGLLPKRVGPQKVFDVNLHEEAQIPAVALRREQNTRSELWSVWAHASLYIRLAASTREGQRPVARIFAVFLTLLGTTSGSFASPRTNSLLPAQQNPGVSTST